MVPTVHANWRYFEMYDDNGKVINSWSATRFDTLLFDLKKMENTFIKRVKPAPRDKHPEFYPKYKKTMRCVFLNAHRNEASWFRWFISLIIARKRKI
jgi:coproporphyrinogen III oxidase